MLYETRKLSQSSAQMMAVYARFLTSRGRNVSAASGPDAALPPDARRPLVDDRFDRPGADAPPHNASRPRGRNAWRGRRRGGGVRGGRTDARQDLRLAAGVRGQAHRGHRRRRHPDVSQRPYPRPAQTDRDLDRNPPRGSAFGYRRPGPRLPRRHPVARPEAPPQPIRADRRDVA